MNDKIKKGLSYFSLFILALGMLPLGNILADEKVEPTKFVIKQNNLEANGFKIANDQVLTSEDVVKLSNVKSVDNLVDVNTLSVSNDQLANVNQANPDGGLYNLTLTNGQQANITVPVVKEGSLTTTNSRGALIFKNLALSQEANNKEKVLEETGVYSVAFNNGYVNSDLTVDINKNSTVVKDTNLGLSKEIPNNMSSQEGRNRGKILNFQQPNSDSAILETGKTNPEKSVLMADENFAALTRAVTPINVTSWAELKEKVNSQASGELQVYALPENISIDNTTITINKGQRVVITSQASKTTVSIGEGDRRLYRNLFDVTNGILDVNNVDFVGTLPEGAVAAKTLGPGPTNSANLSKNVFVINTTNARVNFYKNIEFKNQKIYLDGYGAFADIQNGATSNTYGGKFHNLQAGVWGGTFNVGPGASTANYFLGEYYDQWNTSSSGPFDQWNTQPTLIQRWFGTSVHDNYSKTNGGSFAFAVQGNNASGDNTNGQGNQQVYGKTKIYNNYLYDASSGAITQKCNWGAVYNASKASGKYTGLAGVNKIYNPTPDTNVWIGQTEHSNMDSYFDTNPYGGANGYVVLAEIVYTDHALEEMYANNGVAEGIHGDWQDASSATGTISQTGNYRVIEKQIEGKNYAVLVKSATNVTVKGVDNSVPQNTLYTDNPISIPSVGKSIINVKKLEGYTITGAKVKSNTGSGISPETELTPVRDATGAITGFEINPNNNELGIKELTVEVQYEKIVNNKAEITANNFKLKLNTETASLTADIAKTKANADASYLDGHTPKPTINVDEAQLNAIKAATEVGVMDLTFTVADGAQATPRTVKVSICDDNTAIAPDGSKFLHAKNFTITEQEAKALTEAKAKDKAGVKAWNADGTDLTPNVAVDAAQLAKINKGVVGSYPLKFTVDGLEKTVYVTVTDEYTVVGDKAAIKAKNFRLVLNAETASLTADIAKEKAEADAWYLDGHTPKPTINVDEAQLNAIKAATKAGVMDLTFTVADDPAASRTVKVTILDNSVTDDDVFLHAKNFTITDEEAKALTEAAAKEKAEVNAFQSTGVILTQNVKADAAQLAKIKEGVAGGYPLKFTVAAVEKTVTVTVTDEYTVVGDKAAIRAKNFKLKLNAETASLTADIAKDKAEADAWYLNGHTPKPTINVDEAQLNAIKAANKVGAMDLTFTVADDANATRIVKVTIYDDNTVFPPDESKFLHAKDFTITDEEAKALTEATAKDKAGVKAWNADGTDLTPNVAVDPAQLAKIKEGVAGGYPLKFTVDGLEKTVNVTVTDENTVVGDKAAIRAKNFKLKLNAETASLTADIAKTKAEADAWYLDGHTPKPTINVDEAQLNAIKAATKVGAMDLTFTVADDAKATRIVKVTIYDDNTVISPDESKFLHAKDFTITDEEAKALTEATAKDKAGVKAWNADGTDLTPNVAVDPAQLAKIKEGVAGVYPLKFSVAGLERTVNVNVKDENTICEGNVCITANSFTHNLTDVAQLDEAEAIKKAGARAWYTDSVDTKPTLKVNQQELANIQQTNVAKVFPLTFTTVENPHASKQVDVTVTDNSFELTANNFTIDLATAKNYTNTKLIEDTKAKAVRKDNSGNGTVVVTSGLDAINQTTKAGLFPVTLSVKEDPNTTKQVFITVTDENTVVGDKAAIRAKNFKLKLNAETASLTADIAKTKAEADAWYLDGHTPKPTINVDEAQLNAIKAATKVGVMDLTFTVADDAKATRIVKVTIYNDNTVISPDESKFLHAKDFTITDEEAKALTEATAKDKAGVKAWNADGTDLTPNVAVDPAQLAKIKEGVAGGYPLKFTVDGLEKTVNVTVTDGNTVVGDKAAIRAKNFKLKLNAETASLTADIAKTKAEADAWYLDGHTPKPTINVDEAQLNAIKAANNVGVMDLTFTVADDAKATRIVKVTIYDDNTVISPDESKFLHAKDFTITDEEAKALTEATAKDKAGVKAWNADGTDLTPNVAVDPAQLAKIKEGVAGVYPLKFTVDGLERTVNVNVKDENTICEGNVCIAANSFTHNLTDVAQLDEAEAIKKAGARAWYTDSVDKKPTLKVNQQELANIQQTNVAKVFPLTFTTVENPHASKQVDVTVTDNSFELTANNFTIDLATAKNYTNTKLIEDTKAKAVRKDNSGNGTVVVKDGLDAINQTTKAGLFPVTLSVKEDPNTTKQVFITVTDENTVVGDKAAITAKNFKLKLNTETASLTADIAKDKAEADAWYLDGHTPKPTINVDEAQLNAIKAANKVGVMDLTFTVADNAKATGTVARTVKVTIYDDNTEISPDKFLHAKDFTITDEEAKALTEATAKDKAGVKAWNADGTDLTPNVAVDPAQLAKIKEGVAGGYPLKFTVDGLEKTVNVTVTTNTIILPGLDNKPGTPDDVVVKPKPDQNGNYPKPNPDGSVTLPGGGEITIPGTGNGDITIAPPGSTIKPDGTITTPSGSEVRPNPEGGVELPGQDGSITNKPQDNPLVKPNGNGPITVNPDGSVTLPPNENGTITFPNGNNNGVTNFPGGSTIKPDGTVVTPNGNQVRPNPLGGVELPGIDGSITNNPQDNPVVKPEGNGPITINPDGSVTLPPNENGTVTFPNGNNNGVTNIPGGSAIKPDGTVITPNGNQVRPNPEGGVELPGIDGSITNNPQDNPLVKPNGNGPITVNPDGSVTLPNDQNGTVTFPNNPDNKNEITVPNGSNIGQNGQVTPPGGSPVLPNANGTITIPGADGNLGTPDDGIVTPNGNSTINPDGSLTLPGGGTVDFPGCQLTVEPGGVVLPNGAVINPGANGVLDTPGYAPQAPGQPGNGQQTPGTRAMADNEQANQGQQDATNTNVNDDVYLDPTIVCATPVVKPTAKPQTPTGAASQVVLYATIIAAAVGAIVVIRRNRK